MAFDVVYRGQIGCDGRHMPTLCLAFLAVGTIENVRLQRRNSRPGGITIGIRPDCMVTLAAPGWPKRVRTWREEPIASTPRRTRS